MAHGTGRIVICFDCNQYTWVERFSKDPPCPTCGKASTQTTKDKIQKTYWISLFYNWKFPHEKWETITEPKRI